MVVNNIDNINLNQLFDMLYAHKMEYISEYLLENGLRTAGTKRELFERLRNYVDTGEVTVDSLVELLNEIEGWGDQHIYLFNAPTQLSLMWREERFIRGELRRNGFENLLNRTLPLIMPEAPQLSTIQWTPQRVVIIWVEKRTYKSQTEDHTYEEVVRAGPDRGARIIWQGFRVRESRGLVAFEWDLSTSQAMMRIQTLPTKRKVDYLETRNHYSEALRPLLELNSFELLRVGRAVRAIEMSDEVRRREMRYLSDSRGQVSMRSPSNRFDVFRDDPAIERSREALQNEASGTLGRVYWQLDTMAKTHRNELYTVIYGENDEDHRVSIRAERQENEIRHVLSRIRHYCENNTAFT
jgi:hypothetical protein